jgi:hypothetical protein
MSVLRDRLEQLESSLAELETVDVRSEGIPANGRAGARKVRGKSAKTEDEQTKETA